MGVVSDCIGANFLLFRFLGIPYNYWSQYIGIFGLLIEIGGSSVAVGFCVAALFLFVKLGTEDHYETSKIIAGGLVGSSCITLVTVLSLVTVVGLSTLAGVNLTGTCQYFCFVADTLSRFKAEVKLTQTFVHAVALYCIGFSIISFVLSVGFSVEYSVHIVSRWLHAPMSIENAGERVHYAMEFLMLPTFMSFISSTIGVVCLAFTEFEFTQVYFFRPLIIVMPVTYFFGCWWLPVFLTILDFDFVKFGETGEAESEAEENEKKTPDGSDTATGTGWHPEATDGHVSGEINTEVDC